MSTFSGLTNALSSLNAQQYALSVTADNMANANTPGYTRKTAALQAVGQVGGVPRIYATQNTDVGTVSADAATRSNDVVLDARNRVEQGLNSYAQATQTTQSNVETVFDEPSNTGLAEQLDNFWNAWSNLANSGGSTSDPSLRAGVLAAGATVAQTLNSASTELTNQLNSANLSLTQTVSSMNTDAAQVATLNQKIVAGSASGQDVNDLADQRDALLVTLANLSGATSTMNADGSATVTLPGTGSTPVVLVSGGTGVTSTASAVTTTTTGTPPVTSVTVGGTATGTTTGTLQGVLDAVNTIIPGYQTALDAIATKLSGDVNTQQEAGNDLSGTSASSKPFFSGSSAATLHVAITNTDDIAASNGVPGVQDTDTSNAKAIATIGKSATGADSLYRTMIDNLGNASAAATTAATVQQSVTTSVSNLQQSASGVNMDEETTNVLIFQRAYQASSRVLTTVDEMLDTLINHTGTVGL